jgi:hypothetical protein
MPKVMDPYGEDDPPITTRQLEIRVINVLIFEKKLDA